MVKKLDLDNSTPLSQLHVVVNHHTTSNRTRYWLLTPWRQSRDDDCFGGRLRRSWASMPGPWCCHTTSLGSRSFRGRHRASRRRGAGEQTLLVIRDPRRREATDVHHRVHSMLYSQTGKESTAAQPFGGGVAGR